MINNCSQVKLKKLYDRRRDCTNGSQYGAGKTKIKVEKCTDLAQELIKLLPVKVAFTLFGVFGSTPITKFSLNYKFAKVLRIVQTKRI